MSKFERRKSKIPLLLFLTAGCLAFVVAIFAFIEVGRIKGFYIGTGIFWFVAATLYSRKGNTPESDESTNSD